MTWELRLEYASQVFEADGLLMMLYFWVATIDASWASSGYPGNLDSCSLEYYNSQVHHGQNKYRFDTEYWNFQDDFEFLLQNLEH